MEVLRLHTLGATFVADTTGEPLGGAAAQRRTLALLALLSIAGEAGLSRDKLLGLLWPEVDAERARHSLTQALYNARRALRAEDLFIVGTDIRLNQTCLTSDVRDLDSAASSGELNRVVELYAGPFLDGFYISGSSEFERWTAAQRERIEARVTDALERLALGAEDNRDYRASVEWRRRLVTMSPLDSGGAVRLMTALAHVGDRAGALQHAHVHTTLLREQLGLEPDAAVSTLAEQLRDGAWSAPNAPAAAVVSTVADVEVSEPPQPLRSVAQPHALTPATLGFRVSDRSRGSLRAIRMAIVLGLAALVFAIGVSFERVRRTRTNPPPPVALEQRVVVAPFRVVGAARGLEYLRDGLVVLLSTRLADDTSSRSVDAGGVLAAWRAHGLSSVAAVPPDTIVRLATRLGAERVVIGNVVGGPSSVVITASVLLVPSGAPRGEATVTGPIDSLTTLVDRLAARLLIADADEGEKLSNYTSGSLPALRAFLDGQAAFRRSDFARAIQRYDDALRRDSSFALAALYRALAADELNDQAQLRASVARAWSARSSLSDRDRSLLVSFVGERYPALPTTTELDSAWQRVVNVAPSSAEAWSMLGARLLHDGATAGFSAPFRRAGNAYQRAIALNPGYISAWRALVQLGQVLPESALASVPADATPAQREAAARITPFVRWRAAALSGDSLTLTRFRDTMPALGSSTLRAIARSSQFDGIGLDQGARALGLLRQREPRSTDLASLAMAEHSMAMNRGRPKDALAATTRLRRALPGSHAWLRLRVLDALYADGDQQAAETAAAQLAELSAPGPSNLTHVGDAWFADVCVLAQWRLAHGDTAFVRQSLTGFDSVNGIAASPVFVSAAPNACAVLLQAALAVAQKQPNAPQLLQRLDSLAFTPQVAGDAAAYAPLLLSRLYEQRGDHAAALRAIRRRPYMSGWPRYLANAWLREGRLAELARDSVSATVAFRRFLALRDVPDEELAAQVDTVRRIVDGATGSQ
jgi:DNA-binding SARP family transcriptional activator/tetratricopeptide (TPR) repeat protein